MKVRSCEWRTKLTQEQRDYYKQLANEESERYIREKKEFFKTGKYTPAPERTLKDIPWVFQSIYFLNTKENPTPEGPDRLVTPYDNMVVKPNK